MTEHTLIQIQEVVNLPQNDSELLWGFNIDTPNTSYKTDKYELLFAGWILGKKAQVASIEVLSSNNVIQTIAVDKPRPDVAQTYTEASHASTSGFWEKLGISELPTEVELLIQAVFSDQNRLPISKVKLQKKLPFLEQVKADLARSKTRLQQIKTELNSSPTNYFRPQPSIIDQKQNDSILKYASNLSDQEWFETIVKSVEHPFIDGIELPGFPPEEIQRNSVG